MGLFQRLKIANSLTWNNKYRREYCNAPR